MTPNLQAMLRVLLVAFAASVSAFTPRHALTVARMLRNTLDVEAANLLAVALEETAPSRTRPFVMSGEGMLPQALSVTIAALEGALAEARVERANAKTPTDIVNAQQVSTPRSVAASS